MSSEREKLRQQLLPDQQAWLRRVIHARVMNPQVTEELLQQVLLIALEKLDELEDPQRLGPWLYRIAVRQCLLDRRQRGRERRREQRYAESRESEAVDPLVWLMGKERRAQVRLALAQMSPRDREMLLLKHTENWTYQQIADQLGVSRHVVEYRLLKARDALKRKLSEPMSRTTTQAAVVEARR